MKPLDISESSVVAWLCLWRLSPTPTLRFLIFSAHLDRPLSVAVGYIVVLGFGALFSIFTTTLVMLDKYFGRHKEITSEHFK